MSDKNCYVCGQEGHIARNCSKSEQKSQVCYDWKDNKNGGCTRENCRFAHSEDGKGGSSSGGGRGGRGRGGFRGGRGGSRGGRVGSSRGGSGSGGSRNWNVCYDWQKGECNKDDCKFEHSNTPLPREGDWECSNADCGENNFQYRTKCYKCDTEKGDGKAVEAN